MTYKAVECKGLIPGSKCTLLFIGDEREVSAAITEHVASAHADVMDKAQSQAAIDSSLQNLVIDAGKRAYIGDQFDQSNSGDVRIPGPGFVVRRMRGGGAEFGVVVNCRCFSGDGSCTMTITGPFAECEGACRRCEIQVVIPQGVAGLDDWPIDTV